MDQPSSSLCTYSLTEGTNLTWIFRRLLDFGFCAAQALANIDGGPVPASLPFAGLWRVAEGLPRTAAGGRQQPSRCSPRPRRFPPRGDTLVSNGLSLRAPARHRPGRLAPRSMPLLDSNSTGSAQQQATAEQPHQFPARSAPGPLMSTRLMETPPVAADQPRGLASPFQSNAGRVRGIPPPSSAAPLHFPLIRPLGVTLSL